jgi:tetratricopeptide (TPR) repeat protein
MILRLSLALLIGAYALLAVPFSAYMAKRPVAVKLGAFPDARVIRLFAADQAPLIAEYAITRVLFYFGSLVDLDKRNVAVRPEYFTMFKTLETAVKLDPYNMDAYYFTQAAFTWELGRARDVNLMLAHGMKYRTWDYQLPFYAGFNAAYFLKDYKTAAAYFQKAAELSGQHLFATLSARYFYEAGETGLGIAFLDTMTRGATDPKIRKVYKLRRDALKAVQVLEEAVARFRLSNGRLPSTLGDLVAAGIIARVPADPYGGRFFLDTTGRVRSTSKFVLQESGPTDEEHH